ncbi:MAG: hypothetical protein B7Y69_08295 [Sphingobacteriia bacterium 35-40-8]|nr:MAG: hypothetical protein B7Y69_08295 [Sphingobacteriia bacterium 35-40-8]HQS38319.1 hypothetical protein [Methylotenera sp.]
MATEIINRVGMDMCAPYGVYVNSEQVAIYDSEQEAEKHYDRLRRAAMTPQQRQRERDRQRTVMQTPISSPRYCVMYLKNGKEHHSAWLYCEARAQQGLAMMRAKYGERNAIIYVD